MNDSNSRSSLLLVVSLLLFLMSFIILCTWGYNAYYKSKEEKRGVVQLVNDSAAIAKASNKIASATRDSLQEIFTSTINELGKRFDSTLNYADSLKGPLNQKLEEFFKLKNEISEILKDRNNIADLGLAGKKITELQKKVNELSGKNDEVESENKRLYALIRQLTENRSPEKEIRPVIFENKPVSEKSVIPDNLFQAYDLRLSAVMVDNDREMETILATQTEKLVGSFVVKNNNAINNVAELFIVVRQPDGNVIQKSTWESGTFEAVEGKKIYSCKIRFDYTRGEPKKLLFSLNSEKFQKGNYSMQVYYNGIVIGKVFKTLS